MTNSQDCHLTSPYTEAVAVSRAGFGAGQGSIYLTNLQCNGSESSLLECRGNGPGAFCFHSEDAGVICKGGWGGSPWLVTKLAGDCPQSN